MSGKAQRGPQGQKIAKSPAGPAPLKTAAGDGCAKGDFAGTKAGFAGAKPEGGRWTPQQTALMERFRAEMIRKHGPPDPEGQAAGQAEKTRGAAGGQAGQLGSGAGQAGGAAEGQAAGRTGRSAAGTGPAAGVLAALLGPEQTETSKPNRRENEFMLNLMVLRNSLAQYAPACRDRARKAGKWIWRDIRLLQCLVNRVQDALIRTMPDSRAAYYSAYARNGHYEMHIDGPIRTPRLVVITDQHLAAICEAAIESECAMCIREGAEIGQCMLREALTEVAPPTETEEGRWRRCEYRRAAGDLLHGEEVHI